MVSSTLTGERVQVRGSMSTKRGVAPTLETARQREAVRRVVIRVDVARGQGISGRHPVEDDRAEVVRAPDTGDRGLGVIVTGEVEAQAEGRVEGRRLGASRSRG